MTSFAVIRLFGPMHRNHAIHDKLCFLAHECRICFGSIPIIHLSKHHLRISDIQRTEYQKEIAGCNNHGHRFRGDYFAKLTGWLQVQ